MVIRLEKSKKNLKKTGEEINKDQKDFHCTTVNMSSEEINMCVVPVMVRQKLLNCVAKIYATLGTFSHL